MPCKSSTSLYGRSSSNVKMSLNDPTLFFYRSDFAELKDVNADVLEELELFHGLRRIRQNIVELRVLFKIHSKFFRFVQLCRSCLPIGNVNGVSLPSVLSSVVQGGLEPLTNTIVIPFTVKGRRVVVKVSIANHPSKSIVCIHQGAHGTKTGSMRAKRSSRTT